MRKLILLPLCFALLLVPNHSGGFIVPRGSHPAPRPAPRPAPVHTPAHVAPPRPVAHVYHPAPVHVAPVHRPVEAHPIVRTPAIKTPAAPVHPIVKGPVGTPPIVHQPVRPPVVGIGNRPVVVNPHVMANRNIYVSRGNGYYRPGWAHYHDYYNNWHHGYWGGWYTRPWFWFGAGVAAGWLGAPPPTIIYADPYYVPVPYPVFDYSQPIPVPQPVPVPIDQNAPPMPPAADTNDASAAQAAQLMEQGRQAFLAGNYDAALKLVDQAIRLSPSDTTLHEFRALCLFALQRYQEAAAGIYAVLAVGPGWDYTTMNSFYRDPQTYTNQLRALEAFARANPQNAAARFLLAYHYLVLDYRDAAIGMLRSVVALQPNDQLSAYLLQMLQNPAQPNRPAPGMP